MISGSLGMLPSASLGAKREGSDLYFGMYEPSGGLAPDIAGQGIANPVAQILSAAMLLRFSLGENEAADAIDAAVAKVIDQGYRTGDIGTGAETEKPVGTKEMADAVIAAFEQSGHHGDPYQTSQPPLQPHASSTHGVFSCQAPGITLFLPPPHLLHWRKSPRLPPISDHENHNSHHKQIEVTPTPSRFRSK